MNDDAGELVQACLDTDEFSTIQIYDHYILLHDNLIRHSKHRSIGYDLPPSILRKLFPNRNVSLNEAKIVAHVDTSFYDVIIFADRSAVHTRPELSNSLSHRRLPYYVPDDIELLKSKGFSSEEIDYFITELNRSDHVLNEGILQRIIDLTDMATRLKCREVCRQWRRLVDQSSAWKHVKLTKNSTHFDRALLYFQQIDIVHLDLSETSMDLSSFERLPSDFCLYSLRSLRLSTNHPSEFFSRLFRLVPYLEELQLVDRSNNSENSIDFLIEQCKEHLKCLRRLQIQLRSRSNQLSIGSSSSACSIPISYEIVDC